MADVADRAVLVVGQRLDQDRGSARAIAFVDHLLEGLTVGPADALGDRPFDVVLGHVRLLRFVDDQSEPRVRVDVAAADPGRGLQLTDQLREDLPSLRVEGALLALDRGPLGMTGHRGGLLRDAPARRFRGRGGGARDAQLRRSARPRVDRALIAQGGSRAILKGPEVPSPTARPRGMARSVGASADRYALEVRRA